MGGHLKRPAPPHTEHSVIQHAPPPAENCPSKRIRSSSSEQVSIHPPTTTSPMRHLKHQGIQVQKVSLWNHIQGMRDSSFT